MFKSREDDFLRWDNFRWEAEPKGYCAESGENPELRSSREGNLVFPSRMPPVSNIQSECTAGVVYTFVVGLVLVTVSVYAKIEILAVFLLPESI